MMRLPAVGLMATLLLFPNLVWAAPPAQLDATPPVRAKVHKPTPLEQDHFRTPSVVGQHGMVVCAENLAAHVGASVLRQGGNAVDAAVATALAMAVTLPRAGNLGGGGFMLIRTPQGEVAALDFRETAPRGASRDMFLDAAGNRDADKATVGALCVGVPGTVAGMDQALKHYGTWTLARAIEPARELAQQGFIVPDWLSAECQRVSPNFVRFPESERIFFPNGHPPAVGSVLVQQDLAHTMAEIQKDGAAGFYQGSVGERIAHSVQSHGGVMSTEDLANYHAVWRKPVSGMYRGVKVYSMPPPSSGGVHLIEALNVLEGFDLARSGHNSALTVHRLVETFRQCYADRSKWLGDPDFTKVPVAWLTSTAYADKIRQQIPNDRARKSSSVAPGKPGPHESDQTTHLCAVDAQGMAVSMTYTLNFSYGSGLVADGTGVLLNDEMDDFSAAPGKPNGFGLLGGEANSVQPNKRPLSSMTPTILEKNGKFYAAIGSPGGSHIITVVTQVVLNLLDFGLNAQTAVVAPRMHHQWFPDEVDMEEGFSPDTWDKLRSMGHHLVQADCLGQAMVIRAQPDGSLEGGVDPRRTGGAAVAE